MKEGYRMPRRASEIPILGRSMSSRQLPRVMSKGVPVLKRQYSVIEETICPVSSCPRHRFNC